MGKLVIYMRDGSILDSPEKISAIRTCMQLFDSHRLDNEIAYNQYFDRLRSFDIKNDNIFDGALDATIDKSAIGKNIPVSDPTFFEKLSCFYRFFAQFSKIIKGSSKIAISGQIIGLSYSRLRIKNTNIRDQIGRMTRTLGVEHRLDMLNQLKHGAPVYLLGPQMNSGICGGYKDANKDNIFIIDGWFLVFLFLRSLVTLKIRYFKLVFFYANSRRKDNPNLGFKNILGETSILFGIDFLLKNLKQYDLLLLTANSTIIEILRFLALKDVRCSNILEILHGILMKPTDNFLSQVCQHETHRNKHVFVNQITHSPAPTYSSVDRFYPNEIAVNAFFNSFIDDLEEGGGDINLRLQSNFRALLPNEISRFTPIFTVFGGTNLEGDYFTSESFKFEMMMMLVASKQSKLAGTPLTIIYSAHPANSEPRKNVLNYFHHKEIIFTAKSMLCYLISDFSSSMLSSCIFEANWFDIPTFTPLINSDELCSDLYLDQVFNPSGHDYQSFNKSFVEFLKIGCTLNDQSDPFLKVKKRLAKIRTTAI
jgi:hypothetical protein